MRVFGKVRQDWDYLLNTVRSKRFLYTIIGFGAIIGLAYALKWGFISSSTQQRLILGTVLQLLAGLILITDQIVANIKREKLGDRWSRLDEKRIRVSILVCLVLVLIAVLVLVVLSGETPALWETTLGMIFGLLVVYSIYLYGIQWVVRLLERWFPNRRKAGIESNIVWGNIISLGISLPLVLLTVFFLRLEPDQMLVQQILTALWFIVFALGVLPVFLLSIVFFLVVGIVQLFGFVRQKVNRVVFWLALFALWFLGGVLLLANVLA